MHHITKSIHTHTEIIKPVIQGSDADKSLTFKTGYNWFPTCSPLPKENKNCAQVYSWLSMSSNSHSLKPFAYSTQMEP